MAGETIKSEAVCLNIRPWSRTSHVVSWLTPQGPVTTLVKGAVRPKSAFLGQYDLNYTCEIVYYARGGAELRALRECSPLRPRESLRQNLAALALADRFRHLARVFAVQGSSAAAEYDLLTAALDELEIYAEKGPETSENPLSLLLDFELKTLEAAGLLPQIDSSGGELALRGERRMPISPTVAQCLAAPRHEKNLAVLLEAARVIGVYYSLHAEEAADGRRQILQLISSST